MIPNRQGRSRVSPGSHRAIAGPAALAALIGLGCISAVPASDQPGQQPPPEVRHGTFRSIQFENDVWGSGDDRFYSHGTELAYLSLKSKPAWLTRIAGHVPFFAMGDIQAVQYTVGQQIFTPEDTQASALIEDDRPYAGWLYGSAELLSRIDSGRDYQVGNLLGLTLGVVGPSSYAEQVQKGFHDLIDVDKPQGWDNQLKDEPGILLTYTRKWQYFREGPWDTQFESAPHVVGALGNVYTYGGGGIMFRWGEGLRNDSAPPNIRPGFPGVPYLRPSVETSWYVFAGVEARAMAHNIFLDGNTFRDSHSVDKKPLVADVQLGFAFQHQRWRISLSNVWRSREFDGQDENTQFGAINISFFLPD